MKRATFSILFYIKRTKTLKNGEVPLFVRVTVNGKNCEFSIHRSIKAGLWDKQKNQALGNNKESKEINDYLEHIRFKLYEYKKELEYDNKPVTAIALRNKYCGISDDDKYVLASFKDHNNKCSQLIGSDFAAGTVERYETCYKHIKDFIELNYKREDLLFSEIDHKFIKDFEFYLKTKKDGKCGHNSTVKYIANFKKIILEAFANGWITVNPFRNIKYHLDDVEIIFLDENEIETLIRKEFKCERMQRVKDIFLFCCYTGLAYSDVKTLESSHIIKKGENDIWIDKDRVKTKINCHIPLLPPALQILEKYKNDPVCIQKNRLLPVLSNQKMNSYLKEIADFCGINKKLTTHIGRKTFATTVTLSNHVALDVVSKMLGHTNIPMTLKKYAMIMDEYIKSNMDKVKLKYAN